MDKHFLANGDMAAVEEAYNANARAVANAFWALSDQLVMAYADGFCNGCGKGAHRLGYPQTWLDQVYSPPLDPPGIFPPSSS